MVIKTCFECITLRGSNAHKGIGVDHLKEFKPLRWGFNREPQIMAVVSSGDIETLNIVNVKIVDGLPCVVDVEGPPQKELVLLQEYSTGVGGKRWPGFHVAQSSKEADDITVLSSCGTNKGSGWESHTLLVAPLGWSKGIASQFVDIRDIGDQVIVAYNSDDVIFATAFDVALQEEK